MQKLGASQHLNYSSTFKLLYLPFMLTRDGPYVTKNTFECKISLSKGGTHRVQLLGKLTDPYAAIAIVIRCQLLYVPRFLRTATCMALI
jgi:hypothetical protein